MPTNETAPRLGNRGAAQQTDVSSVPMSTILPRLEHGPHCAAPSIQLRLSWDHRPQAWCRNCGRFVDLPVPEAAGGVL